MLRQRNQKVAIPTTQSSLRAIKHCLLCFQCWPCSPSVDLYIPVLFRQTVGVMTSPGYQSQLISRPIRGGRSGNGTCPSLAGDQCLNSCINKPGYSASLDSLHGDQYGLLELKVIGTLPLLNSLRAKFFRGNINMYLHFMSFLHTGIPKIIEILPPIRPGLTYFT